MPYQPLHFPHIHNVSIEKDHICEVSSYTIFQLSLTRQSGSSIIDLIIIAPTPTVFLTNCLVNKLNTSLDEMDSKSRVVTAAVFQKCFGYFKAILASSPKNASS